MGADGGYVQVLAGVRKADDKCMGACLVGVVHGGGVLDWCTCCAGNKLEALKGGKKVGEALKVNKTLLRLALTGMQGVGRRIGHECRADAHGEAYYA